MPTDLDLKAVHAQLEKTLQALAPKTGKSRYPYYTEQVAGEVIEAVHTALSTCRPVIWSASSVSVPTLYTRFRQGAQYVTDKLDPEFTNKLRVIETTRIPKVGLRIAPREGVAMLVDPNLSWRPEFERYIDDSQPGGEPFERINLPLTKEDEEWIESVLSPLRHLFLYEISKHRLLVVRIHESQRNTGTPNRGTREINGPSVDPTAWATNTRQPAGG